MGDEALEPVFAPRVRRQIKDGWRTQEKFVEDLPISEATLNNVLSGKSLAQMRSTIGHLRSIERKLEYPEDSLLWELGIGLKSDRVMTVRVVVERDETLSAAARAALRAVLDLIESPQTAVEPTLRQEDATVTALPSPAKAAPSKKASTRRAARSGTGDKLPAKPKGEAVKKVKKNAPADDVPPSSAKPPST